MGNQVTREIVKIQSIDNSVNTKIDVAWSLAILAVVLISIVLLCVGCFFLCRRGRQRLIYDISASMNNL